MDALFEVPAYLHRTRWTGAFCPLTQINDSSGPFVHFCVVRGLNLRAL